MFSFHMISRWSWTVSVQHSESSPALWAFGRRPGRLSSCITLQTAMWSQFQIPSLQPNTFEKHGVRGPWIFTSHPAASSMGELKCLNSLKWDIISWRCHHSQRNRRKHEEQFKRRRKWSWFFEPQKDTQDILKSLRDKLPPSVIHVCPCIPANVVF